MTTLSLVCGYVICGLVGLLGLAVLWKIATGEINLARLISEPNGDASMSRFQLLVFTFVIALSLFLVIVSRKEPAFPVIPAAILSLLGISSSSYLVSKGIQFSNPAGVEDRPVQVTITPANPVVAGGQTQQFKAEVVRKPNSQVTWSVIAGLGSIDPNGGLYTAPSAAVLAAAVAAAPGQRMHATIKATSVDEPGASDLAVVNLT